ncbi:MAG: DUF4833 domain-containing protein [Spirochaetota bacterium]
MKYVWSITGTASFCILCLCIRHPLSARQLPINPVRYTCDWAFSISNNLNPSRVVYAVEMDHGGMLKGDNPVYNYMYRKSGVNPRDLTIFENGKAYGIRSQVKENGKRVTILLQQYPELPITIRAAGPRVRAYVTLQEKTYQLYMIYVYAKQQLFDIQVLSVTLILCDPDSGKTVSKRL